MQDRLVSDVTPEQATFKSVLLPIALDDNKMAIESHIIGFYQAVSTDKALRDASTEAEKLLDDFSIESSMREDVFGLVDAVLQKKETLDAESQRLLEKEHKSHEAQYLQRKATGESELVGAPAAGHSPPEDSLRRRSSQESLGSQRGVDDQDGPAKWVERAMSERQQPVRQ